MKQLLYLKDDQLKDLIEKLFIGYRETFSDSKKILNKLIIKNISVSTAESCTGGLLAYNFTKNKDSSKVFKGGYVTYSNEMKIKDPKVKKASLKKNGAVSY